MTEWSEDFVKAYNGLFRALGSEHIAALDNEQRLDLYLYVVDAIVGRVAIEGTVANYEEALDLLRFRLELRDLPDAPGSRE